MRTAIYTMVLGSSSIVALTIGCGAVEDPLPTVGRTQTTYVECGGHGKRYAGGGSCECNDGYDLDPADITNCLPDADTCSGHGNTTLDYQLNWTCACDNGYVVSAQDPLACVSDGTNPDPDPDPDPNPTPVTCTDPEVAYGGTSMSMECDFIYGACTDNVTYALECTYVVVSGMSASQCICIRQGNSQGEPYYPENNPCTAWGTWEAVDAAAADGCGWHLVASDGGAGGCSDTCDYPGDGECDDGGEGAVTGACSYGTDCTDCGTR